ncbi:MAG TPA: phosphate ABC transporter permease PstA [Desulfobacteraceae bacterium]|nr:phosphate ABC transporter permease PstA [Desulfobacteraceae bacterium]HPJ66635.1 phosphate ABC transporter permease PstA [Desulfobacteraceae bacterium]HPQ27753.1 phosphate ABC transporter permease PstA [Desulfobacteraceae bacterium]
MLSKKIEENIFKALMITATLIVLLSSVFIIITILIKGLPAMNLDMITKTPKGGYYLGKSGGILNAIVGSLILTGGATLVSIFFSLPVALYANVYADKSSKIVAFSRVSLDVLWGVPSIVYGAFGFTIMLFFGLKASLLGGIITVALLIFPIMSRAMDEVIRMVPQELLNSSYALGATKFETALKVVVRQSLPGILSAVLIAFGRGIGDAASVIFTAGFSDRIPFSLFEPAATLPLAVFFQLGTPFPEVQERAYASALILTIIVFLVSIGSRILIRRYSKHVIK